MVFITKTAYNEVSCGVVVGSVLKAMLQARCASCRQREANNRNVPPLPSVLL